MFRARYTARKFYRKIEWVHFIGFFPSVGRKLRRPGLKARTRGVRRWRLCVFETKRNETKRNGTERNETKRF